MSPSSPWWRNFKETRMSKSERYANRAILLIGLGALIALSIGWLG